MMKTQRHAFGFTDQFITTTSREALQLSLETLVINIVLCLVLIT
jgi:hypothetical protein